MKRHVAISSLSKKIISTNTNKSFPIQSISFSGAGFLGVYHCGVYACLLKHGHLLPPLERIDSTKEIPPILTGVSAGALISAAISCGVTPDNVMNVCLDVANKTQEKGGMLDVLKPGFSLIDTLERVFVSELKKALGGSDSGGADDYDNDLLMNRIQNGRLLRIGLTDRTKVNLLANALRSDVSAYVYADQYRNIYDIVSSAILSSYIPVGTGPLSMQYGKQSNNLAVSRAWEHVQTMEELGFLKHGETSAPISKSTTITTTKDQDDETRYIDGGIANICPEIDNQTLIVCPINGTYGTHFIAPRYMDDLDALSDSIHENEEALSIQKRLHNMTKDGIHISDRVQFGLNRKNLLTAYLMARSSESTVLEKRFRDGYDDAHRYLNDQNLLTVFTK